MFGCRGIEWFFLYLSNFNKVLRKWSPFDLYYYLRGLIPLNYETWCWGGWSLGLYGQWTLMYSSFKGWFSKHIYDIHLKSIYPDVIHGSVNLSIWFSLCDNLLYELPVEMELGTSPTSDYLDLDDYMLKFNCSIFYTWLKLPSSASTQLDSNFNWGWFFS